MGGSAEHRMFELLIGLLFFYMRTPEYSPGVHLEFTQLLVAAKNDENALNRLIPLIYQNLKIIAQREMRKESSGHTLQPTALVNEAYLKLVEQDHQNWQNRSHFFALASQVVRRILIDHARAKRAEKRGGDWVPVQLAGAGFDMFQSQDNAEQLLVINDLLEKLAKQFPRTAQIVELKYFGGMENEEIAATLDLSLATIKREWTFAKSWLKTQMDLDANGSAPHRESQNE